MRRPTLLLLAALVGCAGATGPGRTPTGQPDPAEPGAAERDAEPRDAEPRDAEPRDAERAAEPGDAERGAGPEGKPDADQRAVVRVVARGFRNRDGQALFALYATAEGFPNDGDAALARARRRIGPRGARAAFRDLAPGTYAVSVLHDEDGDFEMDTGTFGIPKEGYGASNDARGRFGPPKWKDARFRVKRGERTTQTIHLVYH